MIKAPKISIIIPIYNVEKYLPRCLDSVLEQTFKDYEIICVNDGSPDTCGEILDAYAQKDNRVKIVTQVNQGLSMARNNGLGKASGEYVLFLDSDDCIHPQLLEITYHYAQKYNADVVNFGFMMNADNPLKKCPIHKNISNVDKISHKVTQAPLQFCTKTGRYKINLNAWSKLYKRDVLKNVHFIKNICFEDYPHTLSVLIKKPTTVILNEDLYYYTQNPCSISNTDLKIKHIEDYHMGLNAVYDLFKDQEKADFDFVVRQIFPKILKHQLNRIRRSNKTSQPLLYKAFAKELVDLDKKGCVQFKGNKITRYLKYRKLINEGGYDL